MRPLVHIGYHKTATTWFQKAFYPFVRNAHFVPRSVVQTAFLKPTALAFDPDRARAAVTATPGRAILCEEGLSGYLHNGGLAGYLSKEMAVRLHDALPDAEIVIFIRAQPAMIASTYQQYVKGGGTHSIWRYLFPAHFLTGAVSENDRAPRFMFDHFDYDRLIAHYQTLFGRDRVHVFPYEDFRRDPANFLARYARLLDLDVPLDEISLAPVYGSYNRPALIVSRLLGLFTSRTVADKHWIVHIPLLYPLMRVISEGLNRLPIKAPSSRELLGKDLHDWIEHRFGESNRRVEDSTGLQLEALGYPVQLTNGHHRAPPVRRRLPRWMSI